MSAPRFHAEHIGSLFRPADLMAARADLQDFPQSAQAQAKLAAMEAAALDYIAAAQRDRGITPIMSGEFGRKTFLDHSPFIPNNGFDTRTFSFDQMPPDWPPNRVLRQWGVSAFPQPYAARKIRFCGKSALLDEWLSLRERLEPHEWPLAKITVISPTWVHMGLNKGEAYDNAVYTDDDAYFADLVALYRAELLGLYEAGCRNVQIDDPLTTMYVDEDFVSAANAAGFDIDARIALNIRVHNDMLRGLPEDLRMGIHYCRGNFTGGLHCATGSYEAIAQRLFQQLDYHVFYLEYDTARAGGLQPLRYLPPGKTAVLGIVTTKFPDMEDPAELRARVLDAAGVIAAAQGREKSQVLRDSLAVSPQCGFSTAEGGGGKGMTEEVMWAKFALLKQVAEDVWGAEQ